MEQGAELLQLSDDPAVNQRPAAEVIGHMTPTPMVEVASAVHSDTLPLTENAPKTETRVSSNLDRAIEAALLAQNGIFQELDSAIIRDIAEKHGEDAAKLQLLFDDVVKTRRFVFGNLRGGLGQGVDYLQWRDQGVRES